MQDQASAANRRRVHALDIFHASLRAADPQQCISRVASIDSGLLRLIDTQYSLDGLSRIVVVGAGKATPAMAAALEDILGDRISAGAINTKYGHSLPLQYIKTTECGHPIPDEAGVAGTGEMLSLLAELDADSLVIALFSGGGSALMPAPVAGVTLAEKQETTRILLACGAPIDQINTIRKHLSRVKGGQLARRVAPARIVALALSDVVGDRLDCIASGPTYPDPTSFTDCLQLIRHYQLEDQLPAPVQRHFQQGGQKKVPETPKADDPCFGRAATHVIGNNALALAAADEKARELGYRTLVLSSRIEGETRDVAGVHAAIAKEICDSGQPLQPPACIISGGETTVTLRGAGKGGRNQEFALAAALQIDGWDHITMLSGGTDGTDGPTDAAGALADGRTVTRGSAAGLVAAIHLQENNSHPFFQVLDDLVLTGPTRTNVMDLRLILIT